VGDTAVGKSSIISQFIHDEMLTGSASYTPTAFDAHEAVIKYDGKDVKLYIWDTAGCEDLSRLRPLAYPNTKCFLVCFSLVDPTSL